MVIAAMLAGWSPHSLIKCAILCVMTRVCRCRRRPSRARAGEIADRFALRDIQEGGQESCGRKKSAVGEGGAGGFYVSPVRPPTLQPGDGRARFAVRAENLLRERARRRAVRTMARASSPRSSIEPSRLCA